MLPARGAAASVDRWARAQIGARDGQGFLASSCRAGSGGSNRCADGCAGSSAVLAGVASDPAPVLAGRAFPTIDVSGFVFAVEQVADGGRVPAAAALAGGDAVCVEPVRDRRQALPAGALAPDPLEDPAWDPARPPDR